MKLCRQRPKPKIGVNIAALIDVFFLLIIFFMSVSQVTPRQMKLDMPQAQKVTEGTHVMKKELAFSVTDDGGVYHLGEVISLDDFGKLIEAESQTAGRENVEIHIRADRSTDWQVVRKLMDLCGQKQISRVKVGVIKTGSR